MGVSPRNWLFFYYLLKFYLILLKSRLIEKGITNLGNIYSKCYNYLQKGDHTSNLVASEWFAQDGVYKDSLKYAYNKKGNIVSIKSNGELIASYEYDELSRLTRENNKLLNKTTTFSYDKGGNIIQQKEYTYSTLETDKLSGGESKTYAYRSNGWKDQLMYFNGETHLQILIIKSTNSKKVSAFY